MGEGGVESGWGGRFKAGVLVVVLVNSHGVLIQPKP